MWNGENKLAIEGGVDPQLRTRLTIAMRLFQTEHALKLYRLRPFAKKLLGRN